MQQGRGEGGRRTDIDAGEGGMDEVRRCGWSSDHGAHTHLIKPIFSSTVGYFLNLLPKPVPMLREVLQIPWRKIRH